MSRIGNQPISITDKIEVKIESDKIIVKGPKGELFFPLYNHIKVENKDGQLLVKRANDEPHTRGLHGLTNRMICNMITGVTDGFEKELEVVGVGYKVNMKGKNLELHLGYSHPVLFETPEGIDIKVDKMNIKISGIDKQKVGETAAKIREYRKPEPYKGKGVKYIDEHIRRKAGKMTAAAGE